MINRHDVASKITAYLKHDISRDQLEKWAVRAVASAEFDLQDIDLLSDIVSRIGLVSVDAFGLSWEDFENFLARLGYRIQLEVVPA